jgi:hypothetical protein
MKKLAILLFSTVLFSSCSEKAFLTGSILATVKENNIPLQKIQFYNDNGLILEREMSSTDANVKAGALVFNNGKSINRITLEKQTPGALVKEEDGKLLVSFDEGAKESNSLTFAPVLGERGEYFYQLVDETGNSTISRLNFEGNKYLVYNEQNEGIKKSVTKTPRVRLMIMKSSLVGLKVSSKRMKGNRVQ